MSKIVQPPQKQGILGQVGQLLPMAGGAIGGAIGGPGGAIMGSQLGGMIGGKISEPKPQPPQAQAPSDSAMGRRMQSMTPGDYEPMDDPMLAMNEAAEALKTQSPEMQKRYMPVLQQGMQKYQQQGMA